MKLITRETIESLQLLSQSVDALRDAYISAVDGRAQLPPVGYLGFPDRNADCHIKFGHIAGDSIFVVKMSSGFYENPARGLPSNNGIVIAASAVTGEIVAVLDDRGLLTEIRTAVGGAIATLELARKNATVIGIVGTGTQARQHIRALAAISDRPLGFLVWGRKSDRARELSHELLREGIEVQIEDNIRHLCDRSDAIVTTTPSAVPLLKADWIRPGTHITAMGADAPGKQELEIALVAKADCLVMDLREQCLDHGEFSHAGRQGLIEQARATELGAVLAGQHPGRRSMGDVTIADLTGLAVQDIAITRIVLEQLNSNKSVSF